MQRKLNSMVMHEDDPQKTPPTLRLAEIVEEDTDVACDTEPSPTPPLRTWYAHLLYGRLYRESLTMKPEDGGHVLLLSLDVMLVVIGCVMGYFIGAHAGKSWIGVSVGLFASGLAIVVLEIWEWLCRKR